MYISSLAACHIASREVYAKETYIYTKKTYIYTKETYTYT